MFSRRGFLQAALSGLLVQGLGPAWAEAPERSPRPVPRGGHPKVATGSVESLIAAAKLTGVVGFAVLDVANGSVLEAYNPDQQVPPASVAKAVTMITWVSGWCSREWARISSPDT